MARPSLSLFIFGACVVFASAGRAQTVVNLNPTQDAFVTQDNPTENFGAAGALAVASSNLSKGEFDSVIEFNLASAISTFNSTYGAGLWTIQSITLQLFNTTPNNAIFNSPNASGSFTLNWMESVTGGNNWTEGSGTPANQPNSTGITYNTLPNYQNAADEPLGTYSYTAATTGSMTETLGLPAGFLGSVMAGNLISLDALPVQASNIASIVDSENFGTAADRPVLAVTAVPEPGAVGLLFAGSIFGLWRRRRSWSE
jgi:hypothetical protein